VYLKDSIAPDENIGMLMIEESTRETALTMMGLNAGKPFHLPDSGHTPEQLKKAYEDTLGTGRFYLQQDKMFAYSDIDGIIGTIKYLANGCNCKYIILDHISIITSAQENGDERRALDAIVTRLKSLAMQLDIALIIVCHLKRLSGTPAEEGAQITLNDLRGTHGIGQLSNIILALERNGQAPDPKEANTINVRVLKNRFCGRLGVACTLVFDDHHMKFEEIVPPIQQVDGDTSGLPKIGDG
jgi:twinkle protein